MAERQSCHSCQTFAQLLEQLFAPVKFGLRGGTFTTTPVVDRPVGR